MKIKIEIYSDYMCPFCYLALGYMEKLKETWNLDVKWINYEFHPETPAEGVLLVRRFGEEKLANLKKLLREAGAPYGIEFGDLYFMPNSRMVLEASEHAMETGCFDVFHQKVFYEHFRNLADIGRVEVIADLADRSGMDKAELLSCLEENRYSERIKAIRRKAKAVGVGKTPFFIIEDRFSLERPGSIDDIIKVLKETGKERG